MEESVRFKPTSGGSFNPLSMYPVGSIYISVSSTNPSELFGGTWEQISGRFLVGVGANKANTTNFWGTFGAGSVNFPAGELGGEAMHPLTENEMPRHTHLIKLGSKNQSGGYLPNGSVYPSCVMNNWDSGTGAVNGAICDRGYQEVSITTINMDTGNSAPHNNIPPYMTVYMWKRVA